MQQQWQLYICCIFNTTTMVTLEQRHDKGYDRHDVTNGWLIVAFLRAPEEESYPVIFRKKFLLSP